MTFYLLRSEGSVGWTVEITDPDGRTFVHSGFETQAEASEWISHRLRSIAASRAERARSRTIRQTVVRSAAELVARHDHSDVAHGHQDTRTTVERVAYDD
jgi:hypothetical protein